MITARYRSDYDGEFVVTEMRLSNGIRHETREWIPNAVVNSHTSGRAAVIGSRSEERRFQHQRLERHRGGLLGSKRLQTYAWGDLWQDMKLDFYMSTDREQLQQVIDRGYDQNATVFTNAKNVIKWPGHFYLVPYEPYLSDPAAVLYLASFDQHQDIFLIGFTVDVVWSDKNVINDITQVMSAYSGTQYISVGSPTSQPEAWLDLPNFRTMDVRDFVSHCDI